MILTIDGPSGTGKTTIARKVAEALGVPYFDTGAMYRSVALLILQKKITLSEEKKIQALLAAFHFEIRGTGDQKRYIACGQDVTEEIRSQAVTNTVSPVSALPIVREALWKIQRRFAKKKGGVFEGRDMGSVVFPEADIKIFLTASPEVRAERRLRELLQKRPEDAQLFNRELMMKELLRRDTLDASRELAPLTCPKDAYLIDTSSLSIADTVDYILEYREKKSKLPVWLRPRVKLLYRITLFLVWSFFKFFHCHRVYGKEHFYPRGALLAANHTSFFDPPAVAISWPEEVHFLARKSLFKNPFFGWLIRSLNSHPVSGETQDVATFKTIHQLLLEKKKVIVFPEGTRSTDGSLGPLKRGVSLLALRARAAIIPVYIAGTFEVWGKERRFPKLFGKTACVFGSPILPSAFRHLEKEEAEEAMQERLAESLKNLKAWFEAGAEGMPP